ncbi:hypothetical protein An16g07240 [Aspergillus niger]|uniref:Uncharacterized protein n=2 Tax=Aspergillus niger TaxID=5061 RepID=A2R8I2_ASPNC|nr:hypothetical protein An16g07240 [Aspergillus niger]CAL00497.1 hypothetical protein An16g07240 [Aspergillus niger]
MPAMIHRHDGINKVPEILCTWTKYVVESASLDIRHRPLGGQVTYCVSSTDVSGGACEQQRKRERVVDELGSVGVCQIEEQL